MSGSRRDRFRQRIELERDVLTLVNGKLAGFPPLTGLTEATIARWGEELVARQSSVGTEDLLSLLLNISRLLSLASDCSQDVFEEAVILPAEALESALSDLSSSINSLIRDGSGRSH